MISKLYKYFSRKINGALHSVGSMQKYYKIVKQCEEKLNDSNSLDEKKYYRNRVLKYAGLVSARPFALEKARENEEIWQAIRDGKLDGKYSAEVDYIKKKGKLMLYPYSFCEQYSVAPEDIFDDSERKLNYVFYKGKKLFFPWESHELIAGKYLQLIMEQDAESPHRYFDGEVPECDVFVDVGSAEGIISLDAIEKAKEIYLLECDEKWIEALEATFEEYADKVHIVRKYAGSFSDEKTTTLDDLLDRYKNKKIVIKMDIEGMETDALMGAQKVMRDNECVFSCATYHTNTAFEEIESFFKKNDYVSSTTEKWMLFIYGNMTLANGKYQRIQFPYFRHGIIRGEKG